jgi:hypothetical protein
MRRTSASLCLILAFAVCTLDSVYAQVDCVYPGRVTVSHARGQVVDPFGSALPGAVVTLADERGSTFQATTDSQSRFSLAAPPGTYSFTAVLPMFQTSQTHLNVGDDLAGFIHARSLRVILGLNGSYCAWVTTSKRQLQEIISDNKKRSEETAKRNATQK